jgi:threonine/homoserine/homoserine lactone efflux protein
MSLHGLAIFCLTYVIATATPGPRIMAFIARVLSRGTHGLPAFIAGFVVGDLIWLTPAATGMAALAETAHTLFMVVKYLGALYLLYLAYRMWTAPARPLDDNIVIPEGESASRLFAGAVALTLGNPKVMVFFLALLPTVIDLREMTVSAFAHIAGAICIIFSGVLTMYTVAAMRARRLFKNRRAVQWLNRGSGTVMAGAAVAVAASRS